MCMYILFCFFFFSSRRRHTRFDCDWSSDVCSSDLALDVPAGHDSLSFRRIGYRPVVRRVEPVVDVAMRFQAVELEAVSVTTAHGIEREQRTLPYAAQTISPDRLTHVPSTNVLSELQGIW